MTKLLDRYLPATSKNVARTIRRGAAVACGLVLLTGAAWAQPPVPYQPSPTCDYYAGGKCYVVSSTTLTTSSSGAHHFNVCHSVDITDPNGWGGCNYVITDAFGAPLEVGPSYTVWYPYLPPHPLRRAYRFRACDVNDVCSSWSAATYVSRDTAPPYTPGPTSASGCVFLPGVTTECWVQGDFTVSTTPPLDDGGSGVNPNGYWVCRSNDVTGWGGCNVTVSMSAPSSLLINGSHRPAPGYRRAYYFRAQDNAGNKWSPWNTKLYVRRDPYNPTVSATNADPETWYASRSASVSAGDAVGGTGANSGLQAVRYRWNTPLAANCLSGSLTSNGAVLQAPAGDNTLYLCARDWSGRATHWNGRYRVAAQSLGLNAVEDLAITFGGNGYDPSVMLDSSGTGGQAFVQQPQNWDGHLHDTVVEYTLAGLKLGRVTDGHAGWGCLPAQNPENPSDPNNGSGGPDAIDNPDDPGNRLVFYARGPSDTFRGRAWLAYEVSTSNWVHIDKALLHPLYNEPLCDMSSGSCDNRCQNQMGLARIAARVEGAYYYLYLEIRITGEDYPTASLVGVFLMRVQRKSTAPYVELGAGKAQLYRKSDGSWHNLPYDATNGYYLDFANLPGGVPYHQWRILGAITQMGNVEKTPWGEYIITYKDAADVKYTIASDAAFSSVLTTGVLDLSALDITRPNGPTSVNMYRKPGTAEYILFFTDWTTPTGGGRIESARVIPATATP